MYVCTHKHAYTYDGTIHKYTIPGGKHSFERYLACFLGSCKFCAGYAEASDHVHALQDKMIMKVNRNGPNVNTVILEKYF